MSIWNKFRNFRQRLYFLWRYFGSPPWDTGISPPELYALIASRSPGRALDLGCGTGTNAITLARAGWDVTGVDYVGSAIAKARQKAKYAGVRANFSQEDVTHLKNIVGPFDLILDIGCFHSLSQAGRIDYIKQLVELLAPQGVFLLYGFIATEEDANLGIRMRDLDCIGQELNCIQRVDGKDQERLSAWFLYQKKTT